MCLGAQWTAILFARVRETVRLLEVKNALLQTALLRLQ